MFPVHLDVTHFTVWKTGYRDNLSLKATGAPYWTPPNPSLQGSNRVLLEATHSGLHSGWPAQVALLHRLTVAGSRWCGNWESLSLLYGYSTLCCTQRSKCIDSYKISTSQCGGRFARSCSKHSAARKGEGNQYVPFRREENPLQTVKNMKQSSELSCWKKGPFSAEGKHFGASLHMMLRHVQLACVLITGLLGLVEESIITPKWVQNKTVSALKH